MCENGSRCSPRQPGKCVLGEMRSLLGRMRIVALRLEIYNFLTDLGMLDAWNLSIWSSEKC